MPVTILQETETLVLGQESDGFRALGIVTSLAGLAPIYAEAALFWFTERIYAGIELGQYAILYERADKNAPILVPVGFIFWGFLGRAAAQQLQMQMRPLNKAELKSGSPLWVTDFSAVFGHSDALRGLFEAQFKTVAEYYATRMRDGKVHVQTFKNAAHKIGG